MAERTNPHSEIVVGARDDASPSFAAIAQNARKMGEAVDQSANKAGDSIGKIGDNADQTAKKTSSMLAAIARSASESQRAIVEMQGYSTKSAEGFDELARMRGIDADRIKGQLEALRQLREEQERYAAATRDEAGRVSYERELAAAEAVRRRADATYALTQALDIQEAKEREIAALGDFRNAQAAAEAARRRADATYALTQALDIQEARERELAALPTFERERAAADQARRRADATAALTQVLEQQEAAERKLAAQNSFLSNLQSQSEAIGKTNADLMEMKAAQMGVTAQAAPFIAKLREQETQLGANGKSAKELQAALRGVPAQITDIVVSLQGGQAPLTVLLQQGGQLRDLFGGIAPAARALGSAVLGLVNPYTLAAAAVGVIGVAYNQGSKEADAYRLALVSTGNATGTTVGQLNQMAASIDGVVGTQGKAAETLALFASQTVAGGRSLEQYAQSAIAWERASGESVDSVAKKFASLKDDPLAATLKLNEGMNYLTDSVYKQIKSLQEQGQTTEATKVAQDALANALNDRTGEMVQNLGTIERAWRGIKDVVSEVWDAIKSVGRDVGPEGQLDAANATVARLEALQSSRVERGLATGDIDRQLEAARARQAEMSHLAAVQALNSSISADQATRLKARAEADKAALKFLTDEQRMRREMAASRETITRAYTGQTDAESQQRMAAEIEAAEKNIRASYEKTTRTVRGKSDALTDQTRVFAELAGVSSTYYKELAAAQEQRAKGKITEAQYIAYVNELIKKQPFAVALAKEETEARKELNKQILESAKAYEAAISAMDAQVESAWQNLNQYTQATGEQAAALEFELGLMGQSADARALAIEQYKIQIKLKRDLASLDSTPFENDGQREAARLQAINAAAQASNNAINKFSIDAAKAAEDEWKKTSDQINQSLTDALMRGFESGKDFAQNLRDTVVNMFKTMVLRPVISAVLSPVSAGLTGALGLSGTANAGGSAGMLGTAANAASVYSAFTSVGGNVGAISGLVSGTMSLANAAGSVAANAASMTGAVDGLSALLATNGAYGTAATAGSAAAASSTAGAASGGASGALASIPGWGWALAGVAALAGLSGLFKSGGTQEYGAVAQYSAAGGLRQSNETGYRGWDAGDSIRTAGNAYGTGFGNVAYNADIGGQVSGIAASIATALDATAVSFGRTAGFEVATAFATDFGKEATWGALRIGFQGDDYVNWADNRDSKWAPREFKSGEEGYKQYLAEIAKDTRQVLLDMDLPDWADTILTRIGDSATMDQIAAALDSIRQAQQVFASFGQYMQEFVGLSDASRSALVNASGGVEALSANMGTFVDNFYTDAEKLAVNTKNVTDSMKALGFEMPKTREEYKALVESQIELQKNSVASQEQINDILSRGLDAETEDRLIGQLNAAASAQAAAADKSVAGLLALSGAFASVVPAAGDAALAVAETVPQALERLRVGAVRTAEDIARSIIELEREGASLWADLAAAQGDAATAAQRRYWIETAGMSDAERAAFDLNASLREQIAAANALASQRAIEASLWADLAAAQGDAATAAQRRYWIETAGMSDAERAAFDYNQSLREQIDALNAAAEMAAKQQALQIELLRAQGNEIDAVNLERQREIEAMAQFGPAAQDMQHQIWAIIDATAQLEAGAASYFTQVDRQAAQQGYVGEAQAALDKMYGAVNAGAAAAAKATADAASAAAASWRSAAQSIQSSIEKLRAQTTADLDPAARYATTKAEFDALTIAAMGGDADAATRLSGAADAFLEASQAGTMTKAEYMRDRVLAEAKLAGVLETSNAQASLQEAIASSASAAASELASINQNLTGFAGTLYELLSKSYQGADRETAQGVADTFAAMQADFDSYFKTFKQGSTYTDAAFNGGSFTRLSGDMAAYTGADGVVSYLRATESILDVAKRIPELRQAWERQYSLKLPAFSQGGYHAGGLRLVGERGWEVEATGPARIWNQEQIASAITGNGGGNAEVVAELRGLRVQITQLERRLAAIEDSNGQMADQQDDVSEGGNGMRAEIMNIKALADAIKEAMA